MTLSWISKAALSVCFLLAVAAGGHAEKSDAADPTPAAGHSQKTRKERLSGKAADQQRANDCKVPPEKRGASKRPTACAPRKTAQ